MPQSKTLNSNTHKQHMAELTLPGSITNPRIPTQACRLNPRAFQAHAFEPHHPTTPTPPQEPGMSAFCLCNALSTTSGSNTCSAILAKTNHIKPLPTTPNHSKPLRPTTSNHFRTQTNVLQPLQATSTHFKRDVGSNLGFHDYS